MLIVIKLVLAGTTLMIIALRALLDWWQEALRVRGSRAQLLAVAA